MTLDKYWQKRDFSNTPEPRGEMVKSDQELSFFIQRHHARRLHYDFRLELNGTLKSWAVPKGPSLDPADKRLAVHVEDHPLDYGTFEGDIPAHQYGAGHVVLWDRGIWTPIGDPDEGYRKGNLKFMLEGEKLQGKWVLVRMGKPQQDDQNGKENWLLIKEKDEEAQTGEEANITELRPESVKGKKPKKTGEGKSSEKPKPNPTPESNVAPKAPMPEMISPQLATLVSKAPTGDQWLSEVKYDGYRALSRIENAKAIIYTRAGNDWTKNWPSIVNALAELPVDRAWLDGEVVAFDDNGLVNFQALQNFHSTKKSKEKADVKLAYYVFDLLYLNGQDITDLPLLDRKALLKELLATLPKDSPILYSDHITGNAAEVFKDACENGLEGIVVKQADAPYSQARTQNWQKVKCATEQEFVIGGYTDPEGSRTGFGALVLGVYEDDGKLVYAGRVGTGFNNKTLPEIYKKFAPLGIDKPAFDKPPTGQDARGVHWLKPELVAEVRFAQWTDANIIRHASFVALREDKPPQEIVHERPLSKAQAIKALAEGSSKSASKPAGKSKTAKKSLGPSAHKPATVDKAIPNEKDEANIAGVRLSHASKVLFSERNETKLDLALYYEAIEEWLMPHLIDRPLSLLRCPQGNEKECFFQKNYNESSPAQVQKIKVPSSDGSSTYMMANDLQAVVGLVQMGVLELHTWGSKKGSLNKPDRITLDLDPAPDLPWAQVIEGARLVKFLLESIDLKSFIKTTGGKGLHIVVPIRPELDFTEIKAFSKSIAEHLSTTLPDHFTAVMSKSKRTNKIFLDYLRNGVDATAIAAYSTRSRPDASISVPILWDELNTDLHADSFNLGNIQQRLSQLKKDPWRDYYTTRQRVTKNMMRIFAKD
jgi:bifunctional non-homologous end joining protein LigD